MNMPDVDAWDRERDATLYQGPWPIVAHPACGPWGNLRHQYKGSEGGPELAVRAVTQVRAWGGVLEHPSHSLLWPVLELPAPGEVDAHGGWTEDVNQCDWGHVARKRTWVYCVRVSPEIAAWRPPPRKPTHWICDDIARAIKRGYVRKLRATKKQCILTPPLFAEWLVILAESAARD